MRQEHGGKGWRVAGRRGWKESRTASWEEWGREEGESKMAGYSFM